MATYYTWRYSAKHTKLAVLCILCTLLLLVSTIKSVYKVSNQTSNCVKLNTSSIPRLFLYATDDLQYQKWKNVSSHQQNISESLINGHQCIGRYGLRIAYDGVLNLTRTINCTRLYSDSQLRPVLEFASQKIIERNLSIATGPLHLKKKGWIFQLYDCSIMEMIYTKDGTHPAMFSISHPSDENKMIDTSLHWGFMYKFNVVLPSKQNLSMEHSITIIGKISEGLHIYRHTFKKYENKHSKQPKKLSHRLLGKLKNPWAHHTKPMQSAHVATIQKEKKTDFSIMTFNIRNVNTVQNDKADAKNYKARMKHVAKICLKASPDIISFQELRYVHGKGGDWGPNQVNHLAVMLKKYQYVFQPTEVYDQGFPQRTEEGLAIFSIYPIIASDYILLSRDLNDHGDTHQRILLHAVVDIPHYGHVHVFNTHLSLSVKGRKRTVVEIWKHISKYSEPIFLMGDFNAESNSEEVRYFSGGVSLKGTKTSRFNDTWLLTHGAKEKGFTFSTLQKQLTKRIDMIFMRQRKDVTVRTTEVVDDGQKNENAASDHVAVMAKFQCHSTS